MVSAHDVERELRELLPGSGDVKLQKLLYYCQGYHCAWIGEPMFPEEIEAWGMGPVVADLWHDHKHKRPAPSPVTLDDEAATIVAFVAETFGRLSGQALIEQTHNEEPWKSVHTTWFNEEITTEALTDFFRRNGPRGATMSWLEQHHNDPENSKIDLPPRALGTERDSMDELRRLRDSVHAG